MNNRLSKMGENDDLRVLIKEGFNDLGNNMKKQAGILSELKDEMKNTKEDLEPYACGRELREFDAAQEET